MIKRGEEVLDWTVDFSLDCAEPVIQIISVAIDVVESLPLEWKPYELISSLVSGWYPVIKLRFHYTSPFICGPVFTALNHIEGVIIISHNHGNMTCEGAAK